MQFSVLPLHSGHMVQLVQGVQSSGAAGIPANGPGSPEDIRQRRIPVSTPVLNSRHVWWVQGEAGSVQQWLWLMVPPFFLKLIDVDIGTSVAARRIKHSQ